MARLTSALFAGIVCVCAARAQTDPIITSWQTEYSGRYARVWETVSDKSSNNAVSTWPRAGLTNGGGGQATAAYSDVQRVAYSATYVYIQTTGLASYTMGYWLTPNNMVYTSWPTNRGAIHRLPRTPSIPATKQLNRGSGGVLVNGVFVWANGDAQSYTTSTGAVSMQGQGIWNRLAGVAEAFNFDSAYGHQPNSGAYHNHVNPIALRYQLGDNVTYNASTKTYSEAASISVHSPLIGWANDGLPIYGPYGYSSPTDRNSAIRRMRSGFQKRDGTNGTTNLNTTGRTTLPKWAADVQKHSTTLAASEYGPSTTQTYAVGGGVTATYSIGVFAEDYDYMGDLGLTQGVDFDLNRQNVRYCVTPEFPNGTWAYFVCIDDTGKTQFPDIINQEYYGTAAQGQGTVTSITEAVTEYVRGGPAASIVVTGTTGASGTSLSWNSAEGATYKVEASSDNSNWTALNSAVTSAGLTTTYNAASAKYYRVTLTAIATYDTNGTTGTPVGTQGTYTANTTTTTAPTISSQPASATVAAGSSVTFTVTATGTGTLSYQWKKDNADISGATSSSYTLNNVQTSHAGSYTVVVSNSAGSTTSSVATLSVTTGSTSTSNPARLVNLSARVQAGGVAGTPIVGFVLFGTGSKSLLVRAVGPGLIPFKITNALADPNLTLMAGTTAVATNEDWSASDAATFTNVGAFTLTNGSKDASFVRTVQPGNYTAPVGTNGGSGIVLLEAYDAGSASDGAKLVNLSCRGYAGTGDGVLIVGFVIGGEGTLRLLIRGVGPGLAKFAITDAVSDPKIDLYQGSTVIASNDNWSAADASTLSTAFSSAGAFSLTSGSKDAAMVMDLPAGAYTVIVSGVNDATGTALAELYWLQ